MKNIDIIVYSFQSLEDPLVKGLILEYLKTNKRDDNTIRFHLITHEQNEFRLNEKETKTKITELSAFDIKWYPVKYRSGKFILFKKVYNFIETLFITASIKRNYKPVALLGFLSIAGGYSYILSRLFSLKLIVYCFEPHSEYMLDFKIWKKASLKYKLLRRYESLQVKRSDYLVVPNNYTKLLVEKDRPSSNVFVCPISINTDTMVFDPDARKRIRNKLNIENKTVIIYTGKFDGVYYSSDTVFKFFAKLYSQNNSFFFYIITPNLEEVKNSIEKHKLPPSSVYTSITVKYEELNQHVSAADIGFVALPSLPSQIYRTPVKTAIYLSCGLPYIVNKNIAEDDVIALKENVGVVIDSLDEDPSSVKTRIEKLILNDPAHLHQRCRQVVETTRSLHSASAILKEIFSQLY